MAYGSKAALTKDNYRAARAAMMSFRGDNGRILGIMPNMLVLPPSLEEAALEILNAERGAQGATNVWRNTAQMIVTPFLAD